MQGEAVVGKSAVQVLDAKQLAEMVQLEALASAITEQVGNGDSYSCSYLTYPVWVFDLPFVCRAAHSHIISWAVSLCMYVCSMYVSMNLSVALLVFFLSARLLGT